MIYVSRLHYPKGFRVAVRNGTWTRKGNYLLVRANSSKKVTVRVIGEALVQPTHRFGRNAGPRPPRSIRCGP